MKCFLFSQEDVLGDDCLDNIKWKRQTHREVLQRDSSMDATLAMNASEKDNMKTCGNSVHIQKLQIR